MSVEVLEKCLDRVALAIDRAGERGTVNLPMYRRIEAERLGREGSNLKQSGLTTIYTSHIIPHSPTTKTITASKLALPTADAIAMMDLFRAFTKLSSESRE